MKFFLSDKPLGVVREWSIASGFLVLMLQGGCSSTNIGGMDETGGAGGFGARIGVPPVVDGDDPRNWGSLEEAAAFAMPPPPDHALACSTGAECASGFCVDGVCCDNACTGTCQACTAAKKGGGADGTCGVIALYGDPDNECASGSCDGAGSCKMYNGNPCAATSDCLSGYCIDGFCCGNACAETCRACSVAKRGGGYDGQCGPIAAGTDPDGECSGGSCNGSAACQMLGSGNTCSTNAECATGFCVDGFCCDTACSNTCEACSAAKKGSGADGTCGAIAANADPDHECTDGVCNGSGGCIKYNGATCATADECISTYCVDGFCCGNACTGTCTSCSAAKNGGGYNGQCGFIVASTDPDDECTAGECNGSGSCTQPPVLQANGTACTNGAQCTSSNCIDGVCCDTACTGTCEACTAAKKGTGTDGTCGAIKYDIDPDNECANGSCSGAGTCQFYNGVPCASTAECLSNNCVDGYCCGNACSSTCQACSTAKKGSGFNGVCGLIAANTDPDDECGGMCNGSGACQPQLNGFACTSAAECISGFCVDGYCCNNACNNGCMACNNPGSIGTCTAGCAPSCPGGMDFPSSGNYTTLPGSIMAITADFNGNGKPGVAITSYPAGSPGKVSVMLNNGNGTLGARADYGVGWQPKALTAADFTGDGKPDLAVLNYTNKTMSVLPNVGNGTFVGPYTYATPDYPLSVAAADFTNEGRIDLAVFSFKASYDFSGGPANPIPSNNVFTMFVNAGSANFNPLPTSTLYTRFNSPPSAGFNALAARDFTGDGTVDIAIALSDLQAVRIWIGQANGTFVSLNQYPFTNPRGVALGDVDGDGMADLFVSTWSNEITVMRNLGAGNFGSAVTYPYGGEMALGDINGDGKLDLAIIQGGNTIGILLNQGNGTLASPITYPSGANGPTSISIADMNNDGKNDIVVLNTSSNVVSILQNTCL